MSAGPIADYLRALEHALRARGCDDARIVDEAREHLADIADDGVRRGLARDDAERDAVERFGPANLIAAQALPPRSRIMARVTSTFDRVVGNWRWMTGATAVASRRTASIRVPSTAAMRSGSVLRSAHGACVST